MIPATSPGWPGRPGFAAPTRGTGADQVLGWPEGLARQALIAARHERATDPQGFEHRYDDNLLTWARRARRARLARDIAAALTLPPTLVSIAVTDDPHRQPGQERFRPGEVITVTDGRAVWRFLPDPTMPPGERWVLLDECPDCGAPDVPMVPVATLADVGDWLDPHADDRYARAMAFGRFDGDPAHDPGCNYSG